MSTVILQTERLELVEWTGSDSELDAFRVLARDPEVLRFITGGAPMPDEQVRDFIDRQITCQRTAGWSRWALRLRAPAAGEPAGVVGFCGPGCTFAPDVEIGWWLHRDLWNKGLATEAARAAVSYCFATVGFERLICCVHPQNAASLAVAGKVGFVAHGEVEFRGMTIIRHEQLNPLPPAAPDPRFKRDCAGLR